MRSGEGEEKKEEMRKKREGTVAGRM